MHLEPLIQSAPAPPPARQLCSTYKAARGCLEQLPEPLRPHPHAKVTPEARAGLLAVPQMSGRQQERGVYSPGARHLGQQEPPSPAQAPLGEATHAPPWFLCQSCLHLPLPPLPSEPVWTGPGEADPGHGPLRAPCLDTCQGGPGGPFLMSSSWAPMDSAASAGVTWLCLVCPGAAHLPSLGRGQDTSGAGGAGGSAEHPQLPAREGALRQAWG